MKIYQLGGYTVKAKHSIEFPSVLNSLLDCTSTNCFHSPIRLLPKGHLSKRQSNFALKPPNECIN